MWYQEIVVAMCCRCRMLADGDCVWFDGAMFGYSDSVIYLILLATRMFYVYSCLCFFIVQLFSIFVCLVALYMGCYRVIGKFWEKNLGGGHFPFGDKWVGKAATVVVQSCGSAVL